MVLPDLRDDEAGIVAADAAPGAQLELPRHDGAATAAGRSRLRRPSPAAVPLRCAPPGRGAGRGGTGLWAVGGGHVGPGSSGAGGPGEAYSGIVVRQPRRQFEGDSHNLLLGSCRER